MLLERRSVAGMSELPSSDIISVRAYLEVNSISKMWRRNLMQTNNYRRRLKAKYQLER